MGFNIQVAGAAGDEVTIEADGSVNYDIHTNTTTAENNVRITQETGVIRAEHVTYNGTEGIIKASGSVKVTSNDGSSIEADRLDFNNITGIAEFNEHVKLTTKDGITINAEKVTYNNISGLIVATGGVKIIYKNNVYRTDTIQYNLKTGTGSTGSSNCTLESDGRRDVKLIGKDMEIVDGVTKMKKAVFTRCLEPNPEYYITATSIEYEGNHLKLWNPVVFIHGVPVFYLPYLSFQTDADEIPNLEPGYDSSDGYFLKYSFVTPVEKGHNWFYSGAYRSEDTSTYGAGLGVYNGNASNKTAVNFNIPIKGKNYWNITDTFSYNMPLFQLTVDGARDFDSSEKTQYGFSFTRKYWESPLGRWQAGILAREITVFSGSDKYGGSYGGFRLDYNPIKHVTISLLQVEPISTIPDDNSLETILLDDYDYQFGSNWLYNIKIPLGKVYSFGLDGTYNSKHSFWIDRDYRIIRDTDCFSLSFGWDDIDQKMTFDWKIHF